MPLSIPRRPEIPALTSLRFFAALWVAIFHVEELGLWKGGFAWYRALSEIGYAGVSFFFVLSGFILVYVYSGRPLPKAAFFQARFARIYPAYLFSLLVTFPTVLNFLPLIRKLHRTALVLISFPLLLEAWFPSILFFWNAVAWSLSVEAIFYLLFPFLLPRLERLDRGRIPLWIAASWVASLLFTSAYVLLQPDGATHVTSMDNQLFWLSVVKFNPIARLPEFLLGMGFGALFLRTRDHAPLQPQSPSALWPLLTGLSAVALAVALRAHIPYPVLHTGLLAPAFGLIIFGFAAQPAKGLLASRPLILLGEASYSFYLLHILPIVILSFILHLSTSPHIRAIVLAYLFATILVSIAVYLGIERPMRRLLRPRTGLPPHDAGPATAQPSLI